MILGVVVGTLVVLASAGGSVRPWDKSRNTFSLKPEKPPKGSKPYEGYGEISWWNGVWTGIMYVALLAVAVTVVYVVYVMFTAKREPRDRRKIEPDAEPGEPMVEAVETSLAVVERGEPNDAVIACWVALEDAAAAVDIPRVASETAAEFTVRVLIFDGVSREAIETLADLYREARYSTHPPTEETRVQARAALARLRNDLAAQQKRRPRRPRLTGIRR